MNFGPRCALAEMPEAKNNLSIDHVLVERKNDTTNWTLILQGK